MLSALHQHVRSELQQSPKSVTVFFAVPTVRAAIAVAVLLLERFTGRASCRPPSTDGANP